MNRTCTFFLLLFILIAATRVSAQEQNYTIGNFQGGLHLLLSIPQGEFDDNVDALGFGLNLDLGYVFPKLPVVAGISGGFSTYGSKTFKVPFNEIIQTVTVDMTTTNNIAFGHLFLRFQPQTGAFRPYFEGLLGLNYLWTESEVKDERYTDKDIAGSVNLGDVAFSYGAGGGLMFRVHKGETDQPGKGVEVFVDLRVRYLYGGEAKYFTKESLQSVNGRIILDEAHAKSSATDMLHTMLGVTVRL